MEPRPDPKLEELRRILLGPQGAQRKRLESVEIRLDDATQRAKEVGRVLPQAVALRAKQDKALAEALSGPVSDALQKSVKRDPKPLVDAIFPVIGPAIRKAIAHALTGMVQQFNRTVELGLSPKALLWRLEAWRTGRSFGEVVMLKTLAYRVEQVFLIHRNNGLLLQHVTAPGVDSKDADMVSAMLTAIQDFVKDSFEAEAEDAVETMSVGEHSIWVEQGPHCVLAGVIRGHAPAPLRTTMAVAVESIERDLSDRLSDYDGDPTPFETVRPQLESCLAEATKEKRSEVVPVITFFLALAIVLGLGWLYFESRVAENRRQAYVRRLDDEPGIIVTSSERRDGVFHVTGLKDPLARDPRDLRGPLEDEVGEHWQPYQALDPAFVLARARRSLQPPDGITFTLDGTTLKATGEAEHRWLVAARLQAPMLGGVERLDIDGAKDLTEARLDALVARIEALHPNRETSAPRFAELLDDAFALGRELGRELRFEVRGEGAADFAAKLRANSIPARILVPRDGAEKLSLRLIR